MNNGIFDDGSNSLALSNHHSFSQHALGIDLDCDLDQAAAFLHALSACWQGTIIGFMVDKTAGVEKIQRLGIECHQLLGVIDAVSKIQAICDTGVVAMISTDEHVLRSVSDDVVRLLVL